MHVHCRRPLVAKYHNIGCKVMLRSEDEDEHDEACMKEHLQLMSEHLIATKEEITNVDSNLSRAEQINEQVREPLIFTEEELSDAKLKASIRLKETQRR